MPLSVCLRSSWTNWAGDDVGILAETGANVAHAVWVFARRGIAMESFARYLARGVNMTLGTDTCPQSMIEGLRYTAVVAMPNTTPAIDSAARPPMALSSKPTRSIAKVASVKIGQ